jgi:L-ascorbate metabolism protein UlaG (beta-lactamase superfamily)
LISIDCVPAQHFSARSLSDRNKTLWSGFVIRATHGDIYFAGDTGYGPFVEHIKKLYPNGFRLAFLPIGAFKPISFMREMHASPDDAVMMYKELKVEQVIAIHIETFDMAFDKQDEPKERLKEVLATKNSSTINFNTMSNGEFLTIK